MYAEWIIKMIDHFFSPDHCPAKADCSPKVGCFFLSENQTSRSPHLLVIMDGWGFRFCIIVDHDQLSTINHQIIVSLFYPDALDCLADWPNNLITFTHPLSWSVFQHIPLDFSSLITILPWTTPESDKLICSSNPIIIITRLRAAHCLSYIFPLRIGQLISVANQRNIHNVLAYTAPLPDCPIPPNYNALEYTHSNVVSMGIGNTGKIENCFFKSILALLGGRRPSGSFYGVLLKLGSGFIWEPEYYALPRLR